MGLQNFFINRLVKSARGFSPAKKMKQGMTLYQASMTLLAFLLVKHVRKKRPSSDSSLSLMENVQDRFCAYVMFRNGDRQLATEILRDMSRDYEAMGRVTFESHIENLALECRKEFPDVLKKEVLAHLAMFQRLDESKPDEMERRATIRDEWGALFGSVSAADIDEILNAAAGYTFDQR